MKILSLFANIGVAEAYLKEIGQDVVVANELIERRANLYKDIYPETEMISGDITDDCVFSRIMSRCHDMKADCIMATPPCQGMSTAGQLEVDDERNSLIIPVVKSVKELMPKYVFIENVPNFFNTKIKIKDKKMLIPNYIESELGNEYLINKYVINTKDYSVPQVRERAIMLLSKKTAEKEWVLPEPDKKIVTMRDAIGDIPVIDPYIKDVSGEEMLQMFPEYEIRKERALSISRWNIPPHHIKRQVITMMHTPTGKTAFDNEKYYPIKKNGVPVKGYKNTYKRQNWDTPAYTVTMDNRKISSQNNVHPGRYIGTDENGDPIYSDPRTLTLYELMLVMSIPSDWPIPEKTSEAFLRRVIGEGIPPLFVKKVFETLL
ncbi:DNA cytosine methyltransferase [Erysipelotrichaceae bacterium 66-17]